MKHAHVYLVAILLLHAAVAALGETYHWLHAPDGEGLVDAAWMVSPAIYWLPLVALICIWCVVDARGRRIVPPAGAVFVVPLLFPIGVPYYFWQTYPRRAAFVKIGLFVSFAAACLAALWAGRWLAFQYFTLPA